MKWLTKEQLEYIKEHPLEPPKDMAEKFGCKADTIYRQQYRIFGQGAIREMKSKLRQERERVICEMWPTHSSSEIAEVLGVGVMTVASTANRLKLKHDDATIVRIKQKRLDNLRSPESRAKMTETQLRGVRIDRWRIANGMKPIKKRHYNMLPVRVRRARYRLTCNNNYFVDDSPGDIYALYYDSQTTRLSPEKEEYYHNRYGLNFIEADDE
jgi:hypothetical protein